MAAFLKPFPVLFVILCSSGVAEAQFTKSIPLQPIYKEGWKYFYGTTKVNSAYSLQIPLEGIDNKEVNRYFKSYKTFQNLRGFAYLPSVIFLFTNLNGSQQSGETFTYLLLAGVAGDIAFNAISQSRMAKAIDIYNIAIAPRGSLNLQMEKTKSNQTLISFGFRQRF
jgi:hypothetical protein